MNSKPQRIASWRPSGGRYRLHGGVLGTYLDACHECLVFWKRRKVEAEARIDHFENEIDRENDRLQLKLPI
jgi:hypothetical protein